MAGTVIGEGLTVEGEFSSDEEVVVHGAVRGTLRSLAAAHLRAHPARPIWQPTVIVHDAWLRLRKVKFDAVNSLQPAEQLPLAALPTLARMQAGEIAVFAAPPGASVM